MICAVYKRWWEYAASHEHLSVNWRYESYMRRELVLTTMLEF